MRRIYVRPKNSDARDQEGWFHAREIAVTNRDGYVDIDVAERRSGASRFQLQLDGSDARELSEALLLAVTDERPGSDDATPNGRGS